MTWAREHAPPGGPLVGATEMSAERRKGGQVTVGAFKDPSRIGLVKNFPTIDANPLEPDFPRNIDREVGQLASIYPSSFLPSFGRHQEV